MKRLIDLSTLKRNPDAGRTEFVVAGKSYETIHPDGSASWHRDFQRVYSLVPEPEWLYSLEPLEIDCIHCGSTVSADELGEDTGYNEDGGDYVIPDICPKCKMACCCDLEVEIETFREAMERKANAKGVC